jgi:hypothetical protein
VTNTRDGGEGSPTDFVREALELVHHHPGRLRVRAEVFRLGGSVAQKVREATLGIPGVTRFEHSVRTGSILIEYQPGLAEPDAILAQLADAAGISRCSDDALARTRAPALIAIDAVQELNAIASELTGHKADLRSLIPVGLAALSAYSFATSKEPRLPRWDNLLWWSYSVFVGHHREEIARASEEHQLARQEKHGQDAGGEPVLDVEPGPTTGPRET